MQPFTLVEKETGQHCTALCVLGERLMIWKHDEAAWAGLQWSMFKLYEYLPEDA